MAWNIVENYSNVYIGSKIKEIEDGEQTVGKGTKEQQPYMIEDITTWIGRDTNGYLRISI